MYILSDMFLGNINNDKYSYLEGNNFYYTNDGKNYRCQEIEDRDLYEGELNEFYCVIELRNWINEPIELKEFFDDGNNELYLKVNINKENDVTAIYAIPPEKVKNELLIRANEDIYINFNNGEKAVSVKEDDTLIRLMDNLMMNSIEGKREPINLMYNANICFPNMYYREDVKQYVFKNKNIMTYKSDDMHKAISVEKL